MKKFFIGVISTVFIFTAATPAFAKSSHSSYSKASHSTTSKTHSTSPSKSSSKSSTYKSSKSKSKNKPIIKSTNKASSSSQLVDGYTKKNGIKVTPYHRTTSDNTSKNNYDYKGNTNKYTGKKGTKSYNPIYKSYNK